MPQSLDDLSVCDRPPLVLTAFTRPDLLEKVLPAIQRQSLLPSKLIAFVDGARRDADQPLIDQCVLLLESCTSSFPVEIVRREHNLGCDQNVIQGFTEVFKTYNSLVYMEDDTLANPYFYDRMCRLLEAYKQHPQICSISAYANLSDEFNPEPGADFIVSNRVFSWGFGTWRDRWQAFNLAHQSGQYNPFGPFYRIPITTQTKRTLINQFWLEKNHKTDWVITFTLVALYHQHYHLVPSRSLVCNVGFGHPESKTYKGAEQSWVNARYDETFCPNTLPTSLELAQPLRSLLDEPEFVEFLYAQKQFWLSWRALFTWLSIMKSGKSKILLIWLFLKRFPILLKRWRQGLPT